MKIIALSTAILIGTATAMGVTAKPTPVKYTQADGTTITVQLRGDERHHWYQSVDGYLLVNNGGLLYYGDIDDSGMIVPTSLRATEVSQRTDEVKRFLSLVDRDAELAALNRERLTAPRVIQENERRIKTLSAAKATSKVPTLDDVYGKGLFSSNHYPVFGEQKGLVILVEYQDTRFQDADAIYGGDIRAYYDDMLNGDNFNRYNGTGSARKWFMDNSGGQFKPQFDVYGPILLSHNMAYYGGNDYITGDDVHPELMAVEACLQLDAEVNFAEYDRDGDGYIDNAFIIYAGRGESSGGTADTVWPHSWDLSSAGAGTYVFDDKILDRYACSNEWDENRPDGIGTFVHEFSHVLGLPDIYPTSYTKAFTPGDYCVMDYGNYNNDGCTPPNYGIFERNALGWIKPKQLAGDQLAEYALQSIDSNEGYVILTNRADEFFLIENRQLKGWDSYIPGHGMLVWHIDYNSSVWSSNTVNNDEHHQYVDIVEADDIKTTESRGGDTFPGTRNVTSFTHRTSPSMKTWAGIEIKVPLRDIREEDGIIRFNGGYIPVPAPGIITAQVKPQDITTTSFTVSWNLDANSTYYLINVYNEEHRVVWNNKNVGNTDCSTITGLKPDNLYYVAVTPCNEDANGEPSQEVAVRTLPPTLDFLKTTALEATNVGDTYFTANWETFDIATDYIINVYKQEATPLITSFVDFTDGIEGLPQGWRIKATGTTDTEALCGKTAPALYFESNGYLLTSQFPESIKKISFCVKSVNNTPGAQLRVMGMVPGSYAWKEIEIIELDKYAADTYLNNEVPENINSLYLQYVANGDDNKLAIDDLSIIYGGTVLASSEHETYTGFSVGNRSSLKLEDLVPETQYEYNIQAINATHHARVSSNIIVVTKPVEAGIDEVNVDGITPEYFNLQGIQVTNPVHGTLYIERRGTNTRKIIF